jgi:hypothetical protein
MSRPGQLQGGVGAHAVARLPVPLLAGVVDGDDGLLPGLGPDDLGVLVVLHGVLHEEERHDLHQTADREGERQDDEQRPDVDSIRSWKFSA